MGSWARGKFSNDAPELARVQCAEAPPPYVARPIYEICKIPTITPSPDPKPLSSRDTWLLIYRVFRASLSLFRFIAVCLHIPIPSHPIPMLPHLRIHPFKTSPFRKPFIRKARWSTRRDQSLKLCIPCETLNSPRGVTPRP